MACCPPASLLLRDVVDGAEYQQQLSPDLTTTTTLFSALGDAADGGEGEGQDDMLSPQQAAGGADESAAAAATKGSYLIRTVMKSGQALLQDLDANASKGIRPIDALAALFPPTPAGSDLPEGEGAPDAAAATQKKCVGDGGLNLGGPVSVASTGNADRIAVIDLQERVAALCEEGKAKLSGICPVREAIYKDALDELVRQTTVLCPERGLLLAELRDEVAETNRTFDLLFDTACQYAVRKAIDRDLKRTMTQELADRTVEVRTMENRVQELRAKHEGLQKRFEEQRASEEKLHEEEVAFLKKGNQQLTAEIKRLTM